MIGTFHPYRVISYVLSIFVTLLGLLTMIGWHFNIQPLLQISSKFSPMLFNTAIAFFLSGAALLSLQLQFRKTAIILGSVVGILALIVLIGYTFNINLYVNQIFYNPTPFADIRPSSMPPNSALCFFLISICFWMDKLCKRAKERFVICILIAFLIIVLGLVSFLGYVFNWNTGWSSFSLMAISSSVGFIAWGLSYFIYKRLKPGNPKLVNFVSTILVFFTSAIIFIVLWQIQVFHERKQISLAVLETKKQVANKITNDLNRIVNALNRLSLRWLLSNGYNKSNFLSEAGAYREDFPYIYFIAWVNTKNEIKWMAPESLQEKNFPHFEVFDQGRKILNYPHQGPLTGKPFVLPNKQMALPIFIPLFKKNSFDGYLFIPLEIYSYINSLLDVQTKNQFNIRIYDENFVLYAAEDLQQFNRPSYLTQTYNLNWLDHFWTLEMSPSQSLVDLYYTLMPVFTLVAGLFLSAFFALLTYMWEELRETQKRSNLLLESASEGIYGIDLQGNLTFLNTSAAKMLGWTPQEILGKQIHRIIHYKKRDGSHYDISDCPIYASSKDGKLYKRNDEVYWRKDGSFFDVEYGSNPILNKGKIVGVVVTFQDITTRKKDELEIQHQKNHLEAINKELESFSYTVSHDLRAPLRHIISYTKFLEEQVSKLKNPQVDSYLEVITKESIRMGKLIDDLLGFSRAGRFALTKKIVDFNQMITLIISKFQDQIDNRIIEWEISKLPRLLVDSTMMTIVWENLIENALKFTRTRKETKIKINCQHKGEEYIFAVQDNGVGFDMNYSDKLFGVFQRLHSSEEFEGTGIGLSNVQRIIARHGGRVWATSEINQGSEFYFSLPDTGNNP